MAKEGKVPEGSCPCGDRIFRFRPVERCEFVAGQIMCLEAGLAAAKVPARVGVPIFGRGHLLGGEIRQAGAFLVDCRCQAQAGPRPFCRISELFNAGVVYSLR